MPIFYDAPLKAIDLIRAGSIRSNEPQKAWESAMIDLKATESNRKKGCPKNAFLGLCEEGLVKLVPKGTYTGSIKNKHYALKAVQILKLSPPKSFDPDELWELVMNGEIKNTTNK